MEWWWIQRRELRGAVFSDPTCRPLGSIKSLGFDQSKSSMRVSDVPGGSGWVGGCGWWLRSVLQGRKPCGQQVISTGTTSKNSKITRSLPTSYHPVIYWLMLGGNERTPCFFCGYFSWVYPEIPVKKVKMAMAAMGRSCRGTGDCTWSVYTKYILYTYIYNIIYI